MHLHWSASAPCLVERKKKGVCHNNCQRCRKIVLQSRLTLFLSRNYNPKDGRRGKPITKEEAMKELIEVVSKYMHDGTHKSIVPVLPWNYMFSAALSYIWLEPGDEDKAGQLHSSHCR